MSDYKKRKPNYSQQNKHNNKKSNRSYMEIGMHGYLATCNFREKDCIRECYNILNEQPIAENAEVKEEDAVKKESDEEEEIDISSQLENEIADTKKINKNRVFQAVSTDVANCVFIKASIENPVEFGVKIVRSIAESKLSKSKFILRFLPIETICKANIPDITNAAGLLFDKYFIKEPKSYSIIFNRRYNNSINRDELIKVLADLITLKNKKNKVDLKNGQVCVLVEVMKGLCCLSVLPDYFLLKKYNLAELCSEETERKAETAETKMEEGEEKIPAAKDEAPATAEIEAKQEEKSEEEKNGE